MHQLGLADPALLHVLIRDSSTEAETARAARLLGFTPGETVYVAAISCAGKIDGPARMRMTLATTTGRRVVAAAISATTAVLILAARSAPAATPSDDLAVCVGPPVPVEQAAQSWHAARRGLRFTSLPGRPWTTADELGCLVALTDMDPAQVKALPDVQAIGRLSESRSGRGDLALLDCLGRFGSIREIAAAQHMHHSSVAYRLAKIGEILGYDPRTPKGNTAPGRRCCCGISTHTYQREEPVTPSSLGQLSPDPYARTGHLRGVLPRRKPQRTDAY